jgi:hypothetical protein
VIEEKYEEAVRAAFRLIAGVSAETQNIASKIYAHAYRLEGVKKNRSAQEAQIFEDVTQESASDIIAYANGLEDAIRDFETNIPLITEGFSTRVAEIDTETPEGKEELATYIRELSRLAQTFTDVKGKVAVMRGHFTVMRDNDYDPRLTQSAIAVLRTIDRLFDAYEGFETFALSVLHAAGERS